MVRKKLSFISLFILLFLLVSCRFSYKTSIQQGNVITSTQLDHLRLGMTKSEVIQLLGKSLLDHEENDNCWEYIHYNQIKGKLENRQRIQLVFKSNQLVDFQSIS